MDQLPYYMRSQSINVQEAHSPAMKESAKHYREFNSQVSIPEHYILSFDSVLDQIGFGKYQMWTYSIMALMGISEGSQVTIFTLMVPILKNEWKISDSLNSLQASFIFIGFLCGSLLSGQIADRVGRKRPFFISSFFTTIISFGTISCKEIYSLLFLRGLMGILVGLFAPCGVSMLSEITPKELRGRYMGLITLTFALGQLYGLFIAAFTLDTLDKGNWRALTFWCTLPGLFAWVISMFKLEESPRFALLSGQRDVGFQIIQNMAMTNGSNLTMDDETKIRLANWVHSMNRIAKNQENASILSLFQNNRCLLTILIWFNWFILSFVYYGIVLLLPSILQTINSQQMNKDKIIQLVISCISDIFGAVAASFFIEMKGFGRKNSLIIFFFVQASTSMLAYWDVKERFIVWATLSKFFLSMTFIFSYQYTAEVYPTKIRTTGVGMANGLGRLGGVIMPWICMYLESVDTRSPFILFALLSLTTCVSNFFLPFDTMGKELEG